MRHDPKGQAIIEPSLPGDGEIQLVLTGKSEADPAKGWLPAWYFAICAPDGTRMGACVLRVGRNENTYYGGNIGYTVEPPYRGRHYAGKACRLLFGLARRGAGGDRGAAGGQRHAPGGRGDPQVHLPV